MEDNGAKAMNELQISTSLTKKSSNKGQKIPVADSWEDEEDDLSGSESQTQDREPTWPTNPASRADYPQAPPSTPSILSPSKSTPPSAWSKTSSGIDAAWDSPTESFDSRLSTSGAWADRGNRDESRGKKRPETSVAVASRLIAAGIGAKAPQRTDEEKEYDRALTAQVKKKMEKGAEERERVQKEAEAAKKAIWDD